MKKIIQKLALPICAALAVSGCSGGKMKESQKSAIAEDPNVTTPGTLPVVKESIELELGVATTQDIEDYKTNAFTKFLEEKTGIKLKFNEMVNPTQKLKIMLAADDKLPEVLINGVPSDEMLIKYGINGMNTIIDIGEYMDNYGYWLNDMAKKTTVKNFEKRLYTADGARYFMPNVREQTGNYYCGKAFINKKWLDKLGLEMPKTTEDFKKVLEAFANNDPNGNGKKDEIPLTGCYNSWHSVPWHFLVNSFVYDDFETQMVVDKNDKVSSIYFTDEFEEALKYINDLYKNGLYDMNAFTQGAAEVTKIMAQDDSKIGAFVNSASDSFFSAKPERMADYVALPPLEGPKGVAWTTISEAGVGKGAVITKYCQHPLAAFRFLDFMLSEESSMFNRYGVKGKDWRDATASDKGLFENIGKKAKFVTILPFGQAQNSHWQENGPAFRTLDMSDGMAWDGSPYNGEKFKADALPAYVGKGPKKTFIKGTYTEAESEEMAFIKAEIDMHLDQEIPKFITGQRSLSEYGAFKQELKNLDFDRYVEILQAGYNRIK